MSRAQRVLTVTRYICIAVILTLWAGSCTNENMDSQNPENFSVQTETYTKGAFSVTFSFPSSAVEYGSSLEIVLSLEYPEGYTPDPAPITGTAAASESEEAKLANTRITGISQTSPVILSSGLVKQVVTITVEAYLPGTLLFPPVSIFFHDSSTTSPAKPSINITTNSVEIPVTSPFAEGTEEKKLNTIILPETPKGSFWSIPAAIGLVLLAAAGSIIIIIKKKSANRYEPAAEEQTLEQLLTELEQNYLSENCIADLAESADLREAFHLAERIITKTDWAQNHPEKYRHYLDLFREARFSQKSYTQQDGIIQLRKFHQEFAGGTAP